jgi:hypothetical protein
VWAYGRMGVWAYGRMGVWAYGRMGVWAYGRMGVWAYGRVGVWAYGRFEARSADWRGAALDRAEKTRDIRLLARKTGNFVKQAAPTNVSTRVRLSTPQADEEPRHGTLGKTSRPVIPGSRLFNTLFDLPRPRKNSARSSGTIQSGSPPFALSPIRGHAHTPIPFPLNSSPLQAIVCPLD